MPWSAVHSLQSQYLSQNQAWLISQPSHIRYLSGFETLVPEEREVLILLTHDQAFVIKHSFSPFINQNGKFEVLNGTSPEQLADHVRLVTDQKGIDKLFYDPSTLTVAEYKQLTQIDALKLEKEHQEAIWQLRQIKNQTEIAKIRQAGLITVQSVKKVRRQLKVGMTELDVKKLLMAEFINQDADEAFPTIVAFGPHGALPHHQPSGKTKLKPETPVLIDCGARYQGYRADMTRSFWFGQKPTPKFQQIEKLVKHAYQVALDTLATKTNLTAQNIDEAARNTIKQAGFGHNFIHTTGHGVGLDIHEPPSISWRNKQLIKPGMVITIEPGIYLPGKFGYRHENTVAVIANKAQELTV